ncbi:hypothetical protein PVMG_04407 [Plasmodium vivax Mauritania I]|uniref:Uncharacterized protein n=1 Tax=Plasmodium vivax Mauritania I TaxID=1035515 RepID=A0A0J9TK33_PLAVI|nr:hypothetical protein PVMG_04407 [Plasmodium vivax Mauritania I]
MPCAVSPTTFKQAQQRRQIRAAQSNNAKVGEAGRAHMNRIVRLLRKFSSTRKSINEEDITILKKKLRCKFKSVGMLELDTLINNYLNANINHMGREKAKLLYNLMDIDTTNLLKLFYFYSNKENQKVEKLAEHLKNVDEEEIKDTFKLLIDILHNNEKLVRS